jgi:hypothetical protein
MLGSGTLPKGDAKSAVKTTAGEDLRKVVNCQFINLIAICESHRRTVPGLIEKDPGHETRANDKYLAKIERDRHLMDKRGFTSYRFLSERRAAQDVSNRTHVAQEALSDGQVAD